MWMIVEQRRRRPKKVSPTMDESSGVPSVATGSRINVLHNAIFEEEAKKNNGNSKRRDLVSNNAVQLGEGKSPIVEVHRPTISIGKHSTISITEEDGEHRASRKGVGKDLIAVSKVVQDCVEIKILRISNQFIHGQIRAVGSTRWLFFTSVYASPSVSKWKYLWSALQDLDPGRGITWLIGGDFNAILCHDERLGACPKDLIGYWLTLNGSIVSRIPICCTWTGSTSANIVELQSKLNLWNRNVFGHIGRKKKEIMRRLRGIDKALQSSRLTFLLELNQKIRGELDMILM
ncbi:hypothetical protein V6N12_042040 [Hibiscus sabdariffa]|uniref:Reverse transcriptase n=1 Tax=Hibiscus sabdariffa TaxID=183260 RepID=A0ABR2EDL8_9ROSI